MKLSQNAFDIRPDGWTYQSESQIPITLSWPVFEIDAKPTASTGLQWSEPSESPLPNGCTEIRRKSKVAENAELIFAIRIAPDSPIVRFRYELSATAGAKLTGSQRGDAIIYARVSLADYPSVTEVRFSEWVAVHHSYQLNEVPVTNREFKNSGQIMGPILAASKEGQSLVLAYEHGSTWPDAFISFQLSPNREVILKAVHGNTFDGQSADQFETVWFLLGSVPGTLEDLASAFRQFLLTRQSLNQESRKPYIFYNTWNQQERTKHWEGKTYLTKMDQAHMLEEIEIAHRMGIEIFVLDTGWFRRTGDWQVNLDRFPDGLKSIKSTLDKNGMKLGLWFDNSAGVQSDILKNHLECRCSTHGKVCEPTVIWETEPAHRMCLVSRYWEAFADECIRLHREVGVCYFKWDAIDQYGCTDPHHFHGTSNNTVQECADSYAFQLPLYMTKIVEKISRVCPDVIVDFDVTERKRAFGLAFLGAGKFFLVNNGPYCWTYDIPPEVWPKDYSNLFSNPGPARTWICRQPLTFDKWVPMNLFLTHYLPDDGVHNQVNAVASLILGQNGIWGNLPGIKPEGIATFHSILSQYKQVRDDIAAAPPVRQGLIGGAFEVHEKINPKTGRGAVVIFATGTGTYHYITDHAVSEKQWSTPGVKVESLPNGHAKITADFVNERTWGDAPDKYEWAKIVFFGVE